MFKVVNNAIINPEVVDPFWNNTTYAARFDTSVTENQTGVFTPTVTGSIVRATTAPKFGSGHCSKPTGASFLTLGAANNTPLLLGSGDFTVEYHIRFPSNPPNTGNKAGLVINNATNGAVGGAWSLYQGQTTTNLWQVAWYDGTTVGGIFTFHTKTMTVGVWYHVAYYRISGTLYIAVDGVVENKGAYTRNIPTSSGSLLGTNVYNENGYAAFWDNIRITKFNARYPTTNFVPPSKAWPTPTLP